MGFIKFKLLLLYLTCYKTKKLSIELKTSYRTVQCVTLYCYPYGERKRLLLLLMLLHTFSP